MKQRHYAETSCSKCKWCLIERREQTSFFKKGQVKKCWRIFCILSQKLFDCVCKPRICWNFTFDEWKCFSYVLTTLSSWSGLVSEAKNTLGLCSGEDSSRAHLVLSPQTWLENVPTSCQKCPTGSRLQNVEMPSPSVISCLAAFSVNSCTCNLNMGWRA